jgi:uncharacterized protein (TIGR02147 family)
MNASLSYPVKVLNDALAQRKKRNPSYSMRSFANFLDINAASLSSILNGKRPLPIKKIRTVADKLKLNQNEKSLFINCSSLGKINLTDIELNDVNYERKLIVDDETHYNIIAQWEHYALLSLLELDHFVSDNQWIADELNITLKRTIEVIENLLKKGLLVKDSNDQYYRNSESVITPDEIVSPALRASHKEAMDMGKQKIDELDIHLRDFTSFTLPGDLSKLSEAKVLIREFKEKLECLFEAKELPKTNVIQCNLQLFPISGTQLSGKQ